MITERYDWDAIVNGLSSGVRGGGGA